MTTMRPTRYPGLGYRQDGRQLWRIYSDGYPVGPQYASRSELFGDLTRYAAVYGCEDTIVPHAPGRS